MQVGDMGITFYDKDMKPMSSELYEHLRSWNSRAGKDLTLVVTVDGSEKTIVVKTTECEEIAQLMKQKASDLAVVHKRRASVDANAPAPPSELQEEEEDDDDVTIKDDPDAGTFGVGQTHLTSCSHAIVHLQVNDEGLTLFPPASEGLGESLR